MYNYKITFELKSPICFQDRIMFDALVAYAYAQEKTQGVARQSRVLNYNKADLVDFHPMPISLHEDGYFLASWMMYDESTAVEHTGTWKKKWANEHDHLADFGKKKRKVRINNAEFKSYNMPIRIVDIGTCWFFFQSDDMPEVERLISQHIYSLGKKSSQGYGFIDSFDIERVDYNPFENIVRPIPLKKDEQPAPENIVAYMGYYPPYWMGDNQGLCIIG